MVTESKGGWLDSISRALRDTTSFVDVGVAVCDLGAARGCEWTCLTLLEPSGRPLILIDNAGDAITDDHRIWHVSEHWPVDPHLAYVRLHHAPAGDEVMSTKRMLRRAQEFGYVGPQVHLLTLPVPHAGGGLLGIVRVTRLQRIDPAMRQDLTVLAHHVSLRLVHLGVTTTDEIRDKLTPRQIEIAELVADGWTNEQIRKATRLSINTVKKYIYQAFRRLGVDNRTSLAAVMAAGRYPTDVPLGVSRRGHITIARGR